MCRRVPHGFTNQQLKTDAAQTNIVVAESVGPTLLILKPATGNDPEPVMTTSDPHNLSSYDPF
jgi:hypothetical protein